MLPHTRIHDAQLHPDHPRLDIGCEITIDPSYRHTVEQHADAIKAMGAEIYEDKDGISILYNCDEKESTLFDPVAFQHFKTALTQYVPQISFEAVYMTFCEDFTPNASFKTAFDNHRRKNGQSEDFEQHYTNGQVASYSLRDEPVRQLMRDLPNNLYLDYRWEKNGQEHKPYRLVGECMWDTDMQPDAGAITDVQITQMVRSVSLLREHALYCMQQVPETKARFPGLGL